MRSVRFDISASNKYFKGQPQNNCAQIQRAPFYAQALQSVSTCFVGIPSDRILFPSERGDKTSFFQYMSPSSLLTCSEAPNSSDQSKKRRRIIRSICGFEFLLLKSRVDLSSWTEAEPPEPDLEQKDFFLYPPLSPHHLLSSF